jgi:hypothetical protein
MMVFSSVQFETGETISMSDGKQFYNIHRTGSGDERISTELE